MKKHLDIGPEGMKCPCCFPKPGSKDRKTLFKQAKVKEKREAFRIEELNMDCD